MTTLADLHWPRRTARLALRPARADDAAEVWRWHRSPAVTEWLSRLAADQARFTAHFGARLDETVLALLDGRIVGSAKVHVEDGWAQDEIAEQAHGQQCEVGWVLDPSAQGRGFGTELAGELLAIAFGGLEVRRVVAYCFADNTASWKVMEKIGMRLEGRYRAESLHRSGRWLDGMTWAILADEWRAGPSARPGRAGVEPGRIAP
ncbi:MAG: GNAT family N-acetyltransferase [Propionibacteriaceae bacterium]|nr:GNAT family N-acetyltransferase [Propionibacteriaceae bacterium]